jgi:hypothetical protein
MAGALDLRPQLGTWNMWVRLLPLQEMKIGARYSVIEPDDML